MGRTGLSDRTASSTERGEATRQHILEAAAQAFAEHGFAGTSLNDVIRSAGATKGGFYHHFPSKEALALEVVRYKQEQWSGRVISASMQQARAIDQLMAMTEALCDLHEQDKAANSLGKLCAELSEDPELAPRLSSQFVRWVDITQSLLARAQAEGDVRPDIDPRTAAELAVSLFMGIEQLAAMVTGSADLRDRVTRSFGLFRTLLSPTEP
ncbi:MAG: TetR/AcrR family transcriptional regulator [Actinomycetota bacterium]|nr:TetR/AcrR family transcriptional regulator [Actinomycetota bacterium]